MCRVRFNRVPLLSPLIVGNSPWSVGHWSNVANGLVKYLVWTSSLRRSKESNNYGYWLSHRSAHKFAHKFSKALTETEMIRRRAAKGRFDNRELSWLLFNERVLEEAHDERNPLMERARFLAIVASNFDEFAMVRLADLHRTCRDQQSFKDPSGLDNPQRLNNNRLEFRRILSAQYACWRHHVAPALSEQGFTVVSPAEWSANELSMMRAFFHAELEPVLTPLAVDPTRPFPMLAGGLIHLVVRLQTSGAVPAQDVAEGVAEDVSAKSAKTSDNQALHALVTVPQVRRCISLGGGRIALVEQVVAHFCHLIFSGAEVDAVMPMRIARDAEMELEEDAIDDFMAELEEELRHRGQGAPVRMDVPVGADEALCAWLCDEWSLSNEDVYHIDGPLDLTFLMSIDDIVDLPNFAPFTPASGVSSGEENSAQVWRDDPFAQLRQRSVLLHHPFQSFNPVTELVEAAAADDRVLAIKQTLYRVSGNSPIVRALMRAARSGKQVTVLVELKARFDEEANIRWARQLEQAGAHVVYGLMGLKVHSKLLMVIRRDIDGIRRYCHVGTGNFNDKTARLYTDLSYLSANEMVGRDVANLFNMLTGFTSEPELHRLEAAPTTMRRAFVEAIRHEADLAKNGQPGRIIAKCNSLVDVDLCEELYAASQAGVEIDLIIRGMCILRAGVPG